MARVLVLDSGILRLATRELGRSEVDAFHAWQIQVRASGVLVAIPAIADYEVRRDLLVRNDQSGLRALDHCRKVWPVIDVTETSLIRAAELWAEVTRRGLAIDDPKSLGADAILAAQALGYCGLRDDLTIVTTNRRHFERFSLRAASWQTITP